ncbi:hypothetical protein BJL83_04910 [Vibrio parahaemolyticus]|nr:hypothetical protein BJL83_04910 [Vibrio parahaemolyticus]
MFSPVTHHRHDGVTKEYDCWCLFVSAAERLRSTLGWAIIAALFIFGLLINAANRKEAVK